MLQTASYELVEIARNAQYSGIRFPSVVNGKVVGPSLVRGGKCFFHVPVRTALQPIHITPGSVSLQDYDQEHSARGL